MKQLKLYGYWRSSSTWRVRWALEIKKIPYDYIPVNLLKNEQNSSEHLQRNPLGQVPVLELSPNNYLAESVAILDFLESNYADAPKIFPNNIIEKAKCLELVEVINASTQPLQNFCVLKKISSEKNEQQIWAQHWIHRGLQAFQKLRPNHAKFSFNDQVTAADLYLIPQLYNARRFGVDLNKDYPELSRIFDICLETYECQKSCPENQIDAVK